MDEQVKGADSYTGVVKAVKKVCVSQGTIPRCSGDNWLAGCVAAEIHGTRNHL